MAHPQGLQLGALCWRQPRPLQLDQQPTARVARAQAAQPRVQPLLHVGLGVNAKHGHISFRGVTACAVGRPGARIYCSTALQLVLPLLTPVPRRLSTPVKH